MQKKKNQPLGNVKNLSLLVKLKHRKLVKLV